MIQAEWRGIDSFKRRLASMKRRVKPEVESLLRGVAGASARAAAKAAKGHRKSGRLQSSISAHTTADTAGFSAVFYVKANRALAGIRKSAEAAAAAEVKRGGQKLLGNLTK